MLGVFTTTIVVCSCTAFCILLSGEFGKGATGIQLTQAAFASTFGDFGRWIVFLAMFLFGYTTLLADIYYGEVNMLWLFPNGGDTMIKGYRLVSCALVLLGSVMDVASMGIGRFLWSFLGVYQCYCPALSVQICVICS